MPETSKHRTDHRPLGPDLPRPDWLPTEVWPFRLRSYRHRGQVLHYLDEGPDGPAVGQRPPPRPVDASGDPVEAPTVVLVHAGLWSFLWRDLIVGLRPDIRCLTIDFPGSGLSTGDAGDVDLGRFADLIDRWLDDLEVRRATFVVHDLGGVVGVNAAARRPERVDGLVAVNTFAWPADTAGLRFMLAMMGGRAATTLFGTSGLMVAMTRTRFGVGRRFDRAARRAFVGPYRGDPDRRRAFHGAMASASASAELYRDAEEALATTLSHLPVLTVFGKRNDPFGFADRWSARFPDVEARVVPGGNHFPMCDAPADLSDWIRAWLVERDRRLNRPWP